MEDTAVKVTLELPELKRERGREGERGKERKRERERERERGKREGGEEREGGRERQIEIEEHNHNSKFY